MRRTAGYIWTDYKTNVQIAKELKITPVLDKLLEYKRKWIQHVNRMPRNKLPRVMNQYSPTGRRNHGRPLKRLLDTWDRNGSTSGPTPWQTYDDDDLQIKVRGPTFIHHIWEFSVMTLCNLVMGTLTSKTLITNTHHSAQCNDPRDCNMNLHCCRDTKRTAYTKCADWLINPYPANVENMVSS